MRRPSSVASPQVRSHVEGLRLLANELEAGSRELSPSLAKAIDDELARDERNDESADLSPADWEKAWVREIDRRLADLRAASGRDGRRA